MISDKKSYNQIIKATSIFGGVQIFNIVISLIRSKFVAVFLGATGIGIMGVLQTTTSLVFTLTHLGISSSAVRDISVANSTNDINKISRVVYVFFRWVVFTGIIGTLVTIILAKYLSHISFGNSNYTISFILLSITVLLTSISNSQITLLKGMRKVKDLVSANMIGSIIGLVVSVPIFYFFKQEGIVYSILISAIITMLSTWYYSRKVVTIKMQLKPLEIFNEGGGMIKLGVMMTISSFLLLLSNYIIVNYISKVSGLVQLGFYQSGTSITTKYVSMVFAAMAMDFYPRLSIVNEDNAAVRREVNQQAEIGILIIAPILILLISTMPLVVNLLYSKEFLPMVEFVQWLAVGTLIKTLSWPIGYIMLAKSDSRIFLFSETIGIVITLISSIIGYKFYSLTGLGIAISISNLLVLIVVYLIARTKYSFSIENKTMRVFIIQFLLCMSALFLAIILGFPESYFSGSILFIITAFYSIVVLNKRIDLMRKIRVKLFK